MEDETVRDYLHESLLCWECQERFLTDIDELTKKAGERDEAVERLVQIVSAHGKTGRQIGCEEAEKFLERIGESCE